MSVELPTPRQWLEVELEKRAISQNELARRAGLAHSQVFEFAEGRAGADAAVRIANALGIPATMTLALLGRVPPPARWSDVESDDMAHIYRMLGEEDRRILMEFADFLRQKHLQRRFKQGG